MSNYKIQQKQLTVEYGTGMYEGDVIDQIDPYNPYGGYEQVPHGEGTMRFTQDAKKNNITDIYTGQWSNGDFSGSGKLVTNTIEYDGSWANGKREGHGKLSGNGGSFEGVYEGWFRVDQRHGTGTMTWSDGRTFSGQWDSGKMKHGSCRWPEGDSYVGDWNSFKFHGNGVCRYANGDSYDGNWNNGLKEGYGTDIVHGDKYEGYFVGGRRDTTGKPKATLTYASGDVYKGEFSNNKRDGNGSYTTKGGIKYRGKWTTGKWGGHYTLTKARTGEFVAYNTIVPGGKPAGLQ